MVTAGAVAVAAGPQALNMRTVTIRRVNRNVLLFIVSLSF
jgi:hypothetical protein